MALATRAQPGPCGRTLRQNAVSVASDSGGVSHVTVNHTIVVMPTVAIMMYAKSRGRSLSPFRTSCRKSDTAAAAAIAETSDHALMRHQNQRSSSTVPRSEEHTSELQSRQ